MRFDKLIYRETGLSGPGVSVTVDFGIGEITVRSAPDGEVMWRRLSGHCMSVLHMKLAACGLGDEEDAGASQSADLFAWSLILSDGEKPVKLLRGRGSVQERWPAFASLVDLCFSVAENRGTGRRLPAFPSEGCATGF